jgi:hypothetical protein
MKIPPTLRSRRWPFPWAQLLLAVALGISLPPVLAAPEAGGNVVVDWSQHPAGEPPASQGFEGVTIGSRQEEGVVEMRVLDANTDPPSPFPEGKPALMAKLVEGQDATASIRIKPFLSPSLRGWMEVELVPDESRHLTVSAYTGAEALGSGSGGGLRLFIVFLRPGMDSIVGFQPGVALGEGAEEIVRRAFSPVVLPGEPVRLALFWDFEQDPPVMGIEVQSLGDEVGDRFGSEFQVELQPEAVRNGLNTISVGGIGFIGNVTISPEE